MIDNLLGNKTNMLVLRFLTKFDNQFFSIEEIAKETGAGLRNIYDSLKILHYEGMIIKSASPGKANYKFIVDSKVKELVYRLFEEERKRLFLRTTKLYKTLSEIESRIIKAAGPNLINIFLFGSMAKGRDTINSDIDLCVIIEKRDSKIVEKIKAVSFENKYSNDIQIHVFTSKEFISADKNRTPLVRDIIKDGLSLKISK